VSDAPSLCTFTLLSTHSDGPLQIGITTSGKGCKLASRIRREVVASLPPNFGDAIEKLGSMRRRIWEEDHRQYDAADGAFAAEDEDEERGQKADFNKLVLEEQESNHELSRTRRMRWLSQICEYWPLRRLAAITDSDVDLILQSYTTSQPTLHTSLSPLGTSTGPSPPNTALRSSRPQIILAGSGPGHPSLLTMATHRAIKTATYILADKLVPSAVLELIPRRTPVHIARKFPGNAEAAQTELLTLGLEALRQGHTVLRLKQGDPYIYGRGGEEYVFFREHGYTPIVMPGITSALSAPLFSGIPATQRGVADQVLICTGTGRKGAQLAPPPYVATQTVVFLMSLHRLEALVDALTGAATKHDLLNDRSAEADRTTVVGNASPWPKDTPCAVVERASCPDQRVLRSTLEYVVSAVEEEGSRPPGLLVLGKACQVLRGLEGARWRVEEGFQGLDGFVDDGLELVREVESSEGVKV
jgi:uroporphyrin-III C-methyltransferase